MKGTCDYCGEYDYLTFKGLCKGCHIKEYGKKDFEENERM